MFKKLDASKKFDAKFNSLDTTIGFDPKWVIDGDFFGAVNAATCPQLSVGNMVGSVTPDGRKLIIVGTPFGNVVVFQRDVKTGNAPVAVGVCCSSYITRALDTDGFGKTLTGADVDFIFGADVTDRGHGPWDDIGTFLKKAIDSTYATPNLDRVKALHVQYLDIQAALA